MTPLMGNYSLKKPLLDKFNLESLNVLCLKEVKVTSKVVEYILLKCHCLEVLCVEGSSSLVELKVPGPLSKLKLIEVRKCFQLTCLEIHAVNIESFAYHGWYIPVTFEKVPHLVEASYGGCYASFFVVNIGQFASYIGHLKSLVLDLRNFSSFLNHEELPALPVLVNLRRLQLVFSGIGVGNIMNLCASWLERCPMLERFMLEACPRRDADHVKDWRIKGKGKYLHYRLVVFELHNVGGHEEEAVVACSIVSTSRRWNR